MIYNMSIAEWSKRNGQHLYHAVLCDPPYHLVSPAIGWDRYKGKSGRIIDRSPAGFMGKKWDGGDIAFNPETWEQIGAHLLPGGFLMAFASSRGWHRLACAIEDAGFIIHPTIFGWAFGSGFPKATRIDTQVDRVRGEMGGMLKFTAWMRTTGLTARQIDEATETNMGGHYLTAKSQPAIPTSALWAKLRPLCGDVPAWVDELVERIEAEREVVGRDKNWGGMSDSTPFTGGQEWDITNPATPLARAWAGHRYGLQALKPAVEPIIVAQKPYSGKPVDCITKTGAGALNVDGGRIGTETITTCGGDKHQGRWPANFILLDEEAAAALDRQSGVSTSTGFRSGGRRPSAHEGYQRKNATMFQDKTDWQGASDTGGASRFFYRVQEQLDNADPIRYQAKASRRERDAGLEGLPERTKRILGDGITSADHPDTADGGGDRKCRNHHPTVKPIDLARYLATLLLPPKEYAPRKILVPFSGVGSEMIGATLAGWEQVDGIELEHEYVEIAERRLKHWSGVPVQLEFE